MIGPELGSYRVLEKLGEGGMGEVYRARDTRLNRDVAVKVLGPSLLAGADHRARFEREAQLLAALNHPHIAQIYGVETWDGAPALVMELVEGPTLADRLKAGPLALNEALDIARQIVDALDAAHDRGIVHRDLKPANIKVRDDGAVKVLDFGLAKAAGGDAGGLDPMTDSPTVTSPAMTERGVILGTVGYMSPEQARGRPVDRRTDIWAFGCVLYEMLTGAPAFTGDTVTDVLAAVVHLEPDLTRVPARVRRLLDACLQKDPKRRLRDIGDATRLLEDGDALPVPAIPQAFRGMRLIAAGLAIVALALAAALVAALVRGRSPAPPETMTFDVSRPEGSLPGFVLSPDGRHLLIATETAGDAPQLMVRTIETGETRRLPGTDGVTGAFWSPDSLMVAFTARGALKKVAVSGGAAETIATAGAFQRGCWANDGFIVMDPMGGMSKVPAAGGVPVAVTTKDPQRGEIHHEQPACLPDGRFLYFRHLNEVGSSGIYLGDPAKPPDQQSLTPVLVAADGPVLVPGSRTDQVDLLFMQEQTLYVQPFDVRTATLLGTPARVVSPVGSSAGSGLFSASSTGLLMYVDPPTLPRQLTWIDRTGTTGATVGPVIRVLRGLRMSPTGTRAAVQIFPQELTINNDDVWTLPFDGGPLRRLTSAETVETSPVWSPDGTVLVYMIERGAPARAPFAWAMMRQSADGGPAEELVRDLRASVLSDWSRDGRFVLMTSQGDIWAVPMTASSHTPVRLTETPSIEALPSLSPDGRWLAYLSNESGRPEVYVRPFQVSPDGTPSLPAVGPRLLSAGTRGVLRWRRDGRELFYMSLDGRLMSIDVTLTPTLVTSAPRALFKFPDAYLLVNPTGPGLADIAPDGSRILAAMPPADAVRPGLHAIVNWRQAAH